MLMRVASWVMLPLFGFMTRIRVHDGQKLPVAGPAILVANHITEIDPVIIGIAVFRGKRNPRFLAKKSLFDVPVLGRLLTASGQIPVERQSGGGMAMRASERVLADGGIVIVYPEATLTRDPDLWPMVGRSGAVRMAWENGVPVIPVAHWGTQNLLGRYEKRLHWWLPRTRIDVQFGDPVDIGSHPRGFHEAAALDETTDVVMHAVTAELEKLRGPKPSAELWANRAVPKAELTPRGINAEGGRS